VESTGYLLLEISRFTAQAFVSGLWQGLLLIAVAALCLRLLSRVSASARFAVWGLVFALVIAIPLLHPESIAARQPYAPPGAIHLGGRVEPCHQRHLGNSHSPPRLAALDAGSAPASDLAQRPTRCCRSRNPRSSARSRPFRSALQLRRRRFSLRDRLLFTASAHTRTSPSDPCRNRLEADRAPRVRTPAPRRRLDQPPAEDRHGPLPAQSRAALGRSPTQPRARIGLRCRRCRLDRRTLRLRAMPHATRRTPSLRPQRRPLSIRLEPPARAYAAGSPAAPSHAGDVFLPRKGSDRPVRPRASRRSRGDGASTSPGLIRLRQRGSRAGLASRCRNEPRTGRDAGCLTSGPAAPRDLSPRRSSVRGIRHPPTAQADRKT